MRNVNELKEERIGRGRNRSVSVLKLLRRSKGISKNMFSLKYYCRVDELYPHKCMLWNFSNYRDLLIIVRIHDMRTVYMRNARDKIPLYLRNKAFLSRYLMFS